MNEMIEKVAGRVFALIAHGDEEHRGWLLGKSTDVARAALTELREPTSGMLEAASHGRGKPTHAVVISIWSAMIDAALEDGGND